MGRKILRRRGEWQASSVPGLLADLDARHVTFLPDSTSVVRMIDQSGNGFDAIAPTGRNPTWAASRPEYIGKPAIYFPTPAEYGSSSDPAAILEQTDDIATAIAGDRVTIFVVGHSVIDTSNKYFVMTKSGSPIGAYVDTAPQWNAYATSTWPIAGDARIPRLFGTAFQSDDVARLYLSRTAVLSAATMTGVATTGFRIGSWQSAQAIFAAAGYITRVLIYKGAKTQAECEAIVDGLASTYGLLVATAPSLLYDAASYNETSGEWPATIGTLADSQGSPNPVSNGGFPRWVANGGGTSNWQLRNATALLSVTSATSRHVLASVVTTSITDTNASQTTGVIVRDQSAWFVLKLHRTGTLGAYRYWATHFDFDSQYRTVATEITSLVDENGAGSLRIQARKQGGVLQLRVNGGAWVTGDACAATGGGGFIEIGAGLQGSVRAIAMWPTARTDSESNAIESIAAGLTI